jgi:hypothetical protein
MQDTPDEVLVSIYVAAASERRVNIEYFIESTKGLIPVRMWQQFELALNSNGPLEVVRGFVKTKELKYPEEFQGRYLQGSTGGPQVNDFLFTSTKEIEKNKVADETIAIAAGSTKAMHYRTQSNGATIDYWISYEAKPIGLVKLISQHPSDKKQNYQLELDSLIENVRPHIDPADAKPLSDAGKALLAAP